MPSAATGSSPARHRARHAAGPDARRRAGSRATAIARPVAACLLAAVWMVSEALPQQVNARFTLSAQSLDVAEIEWKLTTPAAGVREFESTSKTIGVAKLIRDEFVTERSRVEVGDGRVRPLEYRYKRGGGKRVRDAAVDFDWDAGVARNTINDSRWELALDDGMQDKLSYLLALMNQLDRGQRPASLVVTDGAKRKTYIFEYLGTETIDTVLGSVQALHVRRRTADDDRQTEVWMATGLGYFPVRIEHREGDQTTVLRLEAAEGLTRR